MYDEIWYLFNKNDLIIPHEGRGQNVQKSVHIVYGCRLELNANPGIVIDAGGFLQVTELELGADFQGISLHLGNTISDLQD